ncbi:MAG: YbjN domain-containing protein [Sinobacteraceae bacterium]|nr:YbjN domain-containing protein [Nevskiaceae bacterium]
MENPFHTVRGYVEHLALDVVHEDAGEQILVVDAPERGIHQLILDCEDEILVIEQFIAKLPAADAATYRGLLQINRDIVNGALCLDETGERLIFRDTLALEHLDFNELESTINALSLMLAEHADQLISISKQGVAA